MFAKIGAQSGKIIKKENQTIWKSGKTSHLKCYTIFGTIVKITVMLPFLSFSLSHDSSGNHCLLIDRVVKSDAGWYTVSAINEAGMSTCNARLDVASKFILILINTINIDTNQYICHTSLTGVNLLRTPSNKILVPFFSRLDVWDECIFMTEYNRPQNYSIMYRTDWWPVQKLT